MEAERHRRAGVGAVLSVAAILAGCSTGQRPAASETVARRGGGEPVIRVALFNLRDLTAERLVAESDPAALAAAAAVQRVRPDVLVLQEIDFPHGGPDPAANARLFADRWLARGPRPIDYPHAFAAPVNTGLLTGLDLDRDGRAAGSEDRGTRAYGNDSFGYGVYPGQYGMALLSRHPIDRNGVRTFQRFLWRDLPGHHLPADWYGPAAAVLRLSSKSHWDVPIEIGEPPDRRRLHLWISHPTPPVFDGPEDRNGRRNFDEIGLWAAYLEGSGALVDDRGLRGGYAAAGGIAPFLIAGDLNADPADPPSYDGMTAIAQLLDHPRIADPAGLLTSEGAAELRRQALAAARASRDPRTAAALAGRPRPERATAEFLGGRRVDYLLPSTEVEVVGGGVFWPSKAEDPEGHALAARASDHRLVWLDVRVP